MRSFKRAALQPMEAPLHADDIVEFHAARLLLLIAAVRRGHVDSLTKLAKLDFFVRYPKFFDDACRFLGKVQRSPSSRAESSMIRFRYGPWDPRYYHVLPFLEARGLIAVDEDGQRIELRITRPGERIASALREHPDFAGLVAQVDAVAGTFGGKSGNSLKNLVYEAFEAEVVERPLGQAIE